LAQASDSGCGSVLVTHFDYGYQPENRSDCGFGYSDYDCQPGIRCDCEMDYGCQPPPGKHSGFFQTPKDFDF